MVSNVFEYVRSRPTVSVDPMGLYRITGKGAVGRMPSGALGFTGHMYFKLSGEPVDWLWVEQEITISYEVEFTKKKGMVETKKTFKWQWKIKEYFKVEGGRSDADKHGSSGFMKEGWIYGDITRIKIVVSAKAIAGTLKDSAGNTYRGDGGVKTCTETVTEGDKALKEAPTPNSDLADTKFEQEKVYGSYEYGYTYEWKRNSVGFKLGGVREGDGRATEIPNSDAGSVDIPQGRSRPYAPITPVPE